MCWYNALKLKQNETNIQFNMGIYFSFLNFHLTQHDTFSYTQQTALTKCALYN